MAKASQLIFVFFFLLGGIFGFGNDASAVEYQKLARKVGITQGQCPAPPENGYFFHRFQLKGKTDLTGRGTQNDPIYHACVLSVERVHNVDYAALKDAGLFPDSYDRKIRDASNRVVNMPIEIDWDDEKVTIQYKCPGTNWQEWLDDLKITDVNFELGKTIKRNGVDCDVRYRLNALINDHYIYYLGREQSLAQWCAEAFQQGASAANVPRQCREYEEVAVQDANAGCQCKVVYGGKKDNSEVQYNDHNGVPTNKRCAGSTTITIPTGVLKNASDALGLKGLAEAGVWRGCWPMNLSAGATENPEMQINDEETCKSLVGRIANVPVPPFSVNVPSQGNVNVSGAYRVTVQSCNFVGQAVDDVPTEQPSGPVQEEVPFTVPSPSSLNRAGYTSFQQFIGRALKTAIGLIGSLAFIMFIYAGVRFMTSGGNKQVEMKALKSLAFTGIGILIILSSYILVQFLFGAFS